MQEIFKDIVGYEGLYQVSNLGNIKSLLFNKERILKPSLDGKGYYQISINRKSFKIHRLIALTFIDNPNNYPVINHKNGIKTDNKVENLEWCTQSQNVIHSYKIGISSSGFNHYKSKLTKQQVLSIINDNRFQKDIANEYKVHQSVISRIKNNKTYSIINTLS